jgi:hypothetical protein
VTGETPSTRDAAASTERSEPLSRRKAGTKATPTPASEWLETETPGGRDLTELPARLQAIAVTLGQMLSDGYSKAEIARYFGKSRPWVSARLQELEDGLRTQIERLRDSIDSAEPGCESSSFDSTARS